jgi:hypothetical protein
MTRPTSLRVVPPPLGYNDICPNCGVRIARLDECGCDDDWIRGGGRERVRAERARRDELG